MLRALTFDYWDTLYEGGVLPERVALRRTAVGALLGAYGRALPDEQLRKLYEESGREAERWWSDEQRGYTTNDRLRWILERASVSPASVKEQNVGFNLVQALLSKKVDAILGGFWNYEGVDLQQRHKRPRILRIEQAGAFDTLHFDLGALERVIFDLLGRRTNQCERNFLAGCAA